MIWLIGFVVWIGFGVLLVHRVGQAIGSGGVAGASAPPGPAVMRIRSAGDVR